MPTEPDENEVDATDHIKVARDQRDANEQLLLAAIRAHELTDEAESRQAAAQAEMKSAVAGRAKAEQALLNANRLATVGLLAASIAHELGTPLSVIVLRAQTLVNGEVPIDELASEATVILREAQRMTKMVSEILDLARPKMAINLPVDVAALARRAIPILAPLARLRNIRLELSSDGPPALVRGDSARLLQIVTNLVLNGQQAMHRPGLIRLRVGRRAACPPGGAEAEYIALDVEDEGAGIPRQLLPRLFETFFTTKSEGTGLGLAVSKRIANEHGGFITVASVLGRGSCFTLCLPPLQADPPSAASPHSA